MAGISTRALTFGKINKYRFNEGSELGNNEFVDGSGLEIYETIFRSYDPQIGRFLQVDLLSEEYESSSPYVYALNNPLFFTDPTGLTPEESSEENPKELQEVVIRASYKNNWTMLEWRSFADKNKMRV